MQNIQNITEIFNKSSLFSNHVDIFKDTVIENISICETLRRVEITLLSGSVISKQIIFNIANDIKKAYQLNVVKFFVKYPKELFDEKYFNELLFYLSIVNHGLYLMLKDARITYYDDILNISIANGGSKLLHDNQCDILIQDLIKKEFDKQIIVEFSDAEKTLTEDEYNELATKKTKEMVSEKMKSVINTNSDEPIVVMGNLIKQKLISINEITNDLGTVTFEGNIFKFDTRDFRDLSGKTVTMFVTDYTNSIIVKRRMNNNEYSRLEKFIKVDKWVKIRGNLCYDKYIKDDIVEPIDINIISKEERADKSEQKRVELHAHTKMSAVDGICDIEKLINTATKWGHKAIAITDHGVLQAYPDAYITAKKNNIKVIYGVEAYLVNDSALTVYGNSETLLDGEFIVFDIETTGLNAKSDQIIEIGAVKIENGAIVDTFSTFVKPTIEIPEFITRLTNITDDMVKDAPHLEDALNDFIKFAGESVLVAHNANFDVSFIREASSKFSKDFNNAYIDTVELSKFLLPNLKNYKLNTVAEFVNVKLEGHHRAVNDAQALAEIFMGTLIGKLKEYQIQNVNDIDKILSGVLKDTSSLRMYHAIILVKNQKGLKDLYRLVSNSHIKHFHKKPRMLKSEISAMRENLIIGSACEAGELYGAFLNNLPENEIVKIAEFYDYLEVQPLLNNQFLINSGRVIDQDALIKTNKDIIELGTRMGKLVVATGDVHFIEPQDEVHRRVLMFGHGFTDADSQAPLYFKTTDEMLADFSYLDEQLRAQIVIENTNKIADLIDDNMSPIPKEKHPPFIAGAEEELKLLVMNKAHEIYGENLPEIVQLRIDKELTSIITHGFSVMYMIAQKLVKKSLDDGYLVGSRGSVGSSFVAYLSGITEVNSLCAHYVCPNCKHSEFIEDGSFSSGCDMPDKICQQCGTHYQKDGHDIPFETFLGFNGEKEPDIDLNFSNEYQATAHKYTEELFGRECIFRAGTVNTLADKNAYGYVKKYNEEKELCLSPAEIERISLGCVGVKKTTGQHPGGIMVLPKENEIYEFTPIQYPADDKTNAVITTHFSYKYLHDCLLKLDLLGHVDPTMIKYLQNLTGKDPLEIPMDDPDTMSIFTSTEKLNLKHPINSKVGTFGVPEFGTGFVRQMLEETKPRTFAELIRISGLSHGTDVWINNTQDIIKSKMATLSEAICTRDDIMIYLIHKGLNKELSFNIMEKVRKGKGLNENDIVEMKAQGVPDWYIASCNKIKYMFPKAHAVAYVTMGFRVAYYKVHHPLQYYACYFSIRAGDFDADLMAKSREKVLAVLKELENKEGLKAKDKEVITLLEICNEMYARGISFLPVNLYQSDPVQFVIEGNALRLPFTAFKGLGESVANSIALARKEGEFFSKEDLRVRTGASKAVIEILENAGCLEGIPDSSQMTLF